MTYPPQQPGPYGQPGRYPAQPAPYPGSSGQQPPDGGYVPWQPWGKPPKNRSGLIAALVIIGVLLVGGGVVTVVLLTKGVDSSSSANPGPTTSSGGERPASTGRGTTTKKTATSTTTAGTSAGGEEAVTALAKKYLDAVMSKDADAAKALVCDQRDTGVLFDVLGGERGLVVRKVDMSGDANALITYGYGDSANATGPLLAEVKHGAWCISV